MSGTFWKKRTISILLALGFVLFLLCRMIPMLPLLATREGTVNGVNVNVREAPVSGRAFCQLNTGHELTLLEDVAGSDGYTWYKVRFTNNGEAREGYIRSDLVTVKTSQTSEVTDAAFEQSLEGFPESYRAYLRSLHKAHPGWAFQALQTGLEWNSVIASEIAVVYRNLVPSSSISSWKSLENGAYDWGNNSWYQYEPGWVPASKEILEYYMDPRNFLVSDARILMFQSLRWTGTETAEGVSNILKGTAMTGEFVQYFMEAGQQHNISAYHLATRAVQETNGGRSGSVTGTYKNYFNIGATGANPVAAGVEYARGQGWDTAQKSITEGAKFIASGYVATGQDTLYLQKFDVVDGGNGLYWHQYMGNTLAAESEANKLAKAYTDLSSASVVFTIPVYSNMPQSACIQPASNGNPNNLLASLEVAGYSLTPGFNKFKDSYDVIVPEGTERVSVSASPMLGSSSVSGAGEVTLQGGYTAVTVTVTPTYGSPRQYTIHIAKAGQGGTPPPTVKIGDVNQDGSITGVDMLYLQRHLVGIRRLEGVNAQAADINKDGNITGVDMLYLQRHLVGIRLIN